MGASYSNFDHPSLEKFIAEEYEKQRKNSTKAKKDYLVLYDMVMGLDLPDDYRFTTNHLGLLFMMDWNKDGRFSLDDLKQFGSFAMSLIHEKGYKQHELSQQIQAHCTLQLWSKVCGSDTKEDDFVAWLSRVLQEN